MTRQVRGFSLLELLVALSIMALALGLLYRTMGANARQAGEMETRQRAVLLARSVLASRDALTPEGWTEQGENAGFRWAVQSQPFAGGVSDPLVVPLHEVIVRVERDDDVRPLRLELSTLRPVRRPLAGEVSR